MDGSHVHKLGAGSLFGLAGRPSRAGSALAVTEVLVCAFDRVKLAATVHAIYEEISRANLRNPKVRSLTIAQAGIELNEGDPSRSTDGAAAAGGSAAAAAGEGAMARFSAVFHSFCHALFFAFLTRVFTCRSVRNGSPPSRFVLKMMNFVCFNDEFLYQI